MLQVLLVIGAIFALVYGAQYLSHASQTSSAIHELAGVVGLSVALIMFAVAGIAGSLAALKRQVGWIVERAEQTEADHFLQRISDRHGDAVYALWAIALAGGKTNRRQIEAVLDYIAAAEGRDNLSRLEQAAFQRWLKQTSVTDENISEALGRLGSKTRSKRFIAAAHEIVNATRKGPTPDQEALFERLDKVTA